MATLLVLSTLLIASDPPDRQQVVLVIGAEGTPEYGEQFREWARRWQKGAERAEADYLVIGDSPPGETDDRETLRQQLEELPAASAEPLWLVLIGHGTFDGRLAKFNLRGPDVAAQELAEWLERFDRTLAVVNCASASGPFINRLSGPERVIVTATKSGYEHHYARFGDYLSAAIADAEADLDKDEQTSLLEAFVAASAKVGEFYEQEGRLSTEHALLDDNGDRRGTPADWFRGVRATRSAKEEAEPDGRRARQLCLVRSPWEASLSPEVRARRDELEHEVERLRDRKPEMDEDRYYAELETVMVELAELYDEAGPGEDDE